MATHPSEIIVIEPSDLVIDIEIDEIIDLSILSAGNYLAYEQAVLKLTNEVRECHGVGPLVHNAHLTQSAMAHTLDMIENNFFAHRGSDQSQVSDRAIRAGYTNFAIVGENLAKGHPTPKDAIKGWMNSPGHRDNMLRPEYRELGVAYVLASVVDSYGHKRSVPFWTQNFGARRQPEDAAAMLSRWWRNAQQPIVELIEEDDLEITILDTSQADATS